jgi:hypothetical protein
LEPQTCNLLIVELEHEVLREPSWVSLHGVDLVSSPRKVPVDRDGAIGTGHEFDVAHLRSDVGEMKTDVRALLDRMDTRVDRLESTMDSHFIWLI